MIHYIKIEKNMIIYHNRWIKTYRYETGNKIPNGRCTIDTEIEDEEENVVFCVNKIICQK